MSDEAARTSRRAPRRAPVLVAVLALLVLAGLLGPVTAGADEIDDKRAEAAEVAQRLSELDSELMLLAGDLEKAKHDLDTANQQIAEANDRVARAQGTLDQQREDLARVAVVAYVGGDNLPSADVLLTSEPDQGPRKQVYLTAATGNLRDLIDQVREDEASAQHEREVLATAQARAEQIAAEITERQQRAEEALAEQTEIQARIDGELAVLVAEEQQRIAEEQARREEEAARQAERAAATEQASSPTAGGARTATTAGGPAPAPAPAPAPGVTPAPTPGPSPTTPTTQGPSPTVPPAPTPTNPPPPTTPTPPPTTAPPAPPPPPPPTSVPPAPAGAQAAVQAALGKIGSPYVWAAAGPNSFDCSGLTMWAWAQAGKSLWHYTGSQYTQTARVPINQLQPGDLVFFWGPGVTGDPGHVGLYIGGGQMVHAPRAGSNVKIDSIYYWYGARLAGGRVR